MLDRRVTLAHLPTPVLPADRLAAHLGLEPGRLWVKHDDLTGLAGGGNKVRKLEYLCADALAQGCDTLVTGGGRQSNHVRMTAAAANRLGLACTVVLGGGRPERPTGNVVLDELLGPEIVWAGDLDYPGLEAAITATAARVAEAGRLPYAVPVGGASPLGTLGYVRAAEELAAQVPDVEVVVVADGSGGTHAGLVAGFGDHARVLGVDVGTRPGLAEAVTATAVEAAAMAGLPAPVGSCQLDGERIGAGYGAPSAEARRALDLAARLEGLVLDPVYTGKAMAGLIAAVGDGRIGTTGPIVFVHTGGMPALFATSYAAWVREGTSDDEEWRRGGWRLSLTGGPRAAVTGTLSGPGSTTARTTMGFLDKAKKAVVDHADQIDGAVDKAANLADKRTKGKHTSKIDKASGKARDLLRGLDDGPGKGGGRGPAAGDDLPPRL